MHAAVRQVHQLPEVSVVIPVLNEAPNVVALAREVAAALAGREYEILFVDDGSTDGTAQVLRELRDNGLPRLRILRHTRRRGQSAGLITGVRNARAPRIVTLDGDGQNDPADIPRLLAALASASVPPVRLVMGHRTERRDTLRRRLQSRIANGVRRSLLHDSTPDTGCGIKAFDRALFVELPQFDHMHRFLPALALSFGARVVSVPVSHRPRQRGVSKYGMFDRLGAGIVDLFGVMWLRRRFHPGSAFQEE